MRENSKTKTKKGRKASNCKHPEHKLFVIDFFYFLHLHGYLVYISLHSFYTGKKLQRSVLKGLRNQPLTSR